jgi:hypothetical protein
MEVSLINNDGLVIIENLTTTQDGPTCVADVVEKHKRFKTDTKYMYPKWSP